MKNFSVYHDYEELYLFLRCINNKPGKFNIQLFNHLQMSSL